MSREEIAQSKEYIFANEACKYCEQDSIQAFEDGAEYGYKFAVEKACEWLKEQYEMVGVSFKEDFIERFKEDMKGE